jgi:murein DD-endopeptidase MepM/ murein hydrolase activator NlpD
MRALLLLALVAPVPGEVTRGFDPGRPYEGGRHRGVDLAAAPGTAVRAACAGPVVFAGRIGGTGIVTLRCGPWRVTHMPLARIAARGRVARGAVIGTVAASQAHEGVHLGVRRDGTRFGYVDPLRFLGRRSPPAPLGRAPRGRGRGP